MRTGAVSGARAGWLAAVAGDAEVAARLSEERSLADMLRVEAAYARALGRTGQVAAALAEEAAAAIEGFAPDRENLAREAVRDGLPVPALVRQLKAALPARLHAALHAGLTSQDVIDTGLVLALADLLELFEARLAGLVRQLAALEARFGHAPLTARTRMQAALPVAMRDRIALWARPLDRHRARLDELRPRLLVLQLGGPVGTRGSFGGRGDAIARAMAEELGLAAPDTAWHTDRAALAELGGWLSLVSGSLGKMGHDLALMAQQGVDAARLSGGGASSAMAHKANPVGAELLMTLARFNAVQLPGMHLALDHEQERSGAAWTLEWLILPSMLTATGAALGRAATLLGSVEALGEGAAGG